jgi:hypothetical protein
VEKLGISESISEVTTVARQTVADYQSEAESGANPPSFVGVVETDITGRPVRKPGKTIADGENGLSRFLTLNGAGADRDIKGNGSAETPVVYSLTPPSGQVFQVTSMLISLTGTSMPLGGFGAIAAPGLTNGCKFAVTVNGTPVFDLLGGFTLKTNGDIVSYGTAELGIKAAGTFDVLTAAFNPYAVSGSPLSLDSAIGAALTFTVQDNLTTVGVFRIHCRGWLEPSV